MKGCDDMVSYSPPSCFECKFYRRAPQFIGDSGKCIKYPDNIPRRIYFQSGECKYFEAK